MRVGLLIFICFAVWCVAYNRFSVASWQTPIEYGIDPAASDVKFNLALIKSAADGNFWPLLPKRVPSLGAPYTADWNDFPIIEEFLFFFSGLAAKCIGVFAALNLAVLVSQVLAAVALYVTCRALKCSWRWSFAIGILYGFCTYAFAHAAHHVTVTCYWQVPLCLLVCQWIGNGMKFGGRRHWFALAIAAIAGLQNVYYTAMFIQLAALACLVQVIRRQQCPWKSVVTVIGVSIGAFVLMNVDTFYYHLVSGQNPAAVVRNYKWLEFYALKIIDMLIPPPYHPVLGDLGASYFKQTLLPAEEPPACYLGLVGVASLAWLCGLALVRAVRRPPGVVPTEAMQVIWITLYSVVGGLNGLVGICGIQFFRSTTRYCIFILAIVSIFAARRLSIIEKQWPMPMRFIIPLLVCAFALWEQVPPQPRANEIQRTAAVVDADRRFVAEMEKRLPSGAMVFQIPVMEFPESPAPGVSAYDHFRPYFFAKHLRFSFGTTKGRPRENWQRRLAAIDPDKAVAALEDYGFSAIYVNRSGFQDRGRALLAALAASGRSELIENSLGDLVCVLLRPTSTKLPPDF